jgi:4'-phosphopantetheinyl transferase superfamily
MTVSVDVWAIRSPRADDAVHRALPGILRTYLGGEPWIVRAPGEKPSLADRPDVRFSIAHTAGLALVAVSLRGEVGIDVERLAPSRVDLAVADRFLGHDVAAALGALPVEARTRHFLLAWTRLEAAAKGVGVGVDAMARGPGGGVLVELALGPEHVGSLWVDAAEPPAVAGPRFIDGAEMESAVRSPHA